VDQAHGAADAGDQHARHRPVRQSPAAETCMAPCTTTSMCPPRVPGRLPSPRATHAPHSPP
jgi:hypothetical protein